MNATQQATELIARGKSQSEAAASVGLSLLTVQRWITTGVFRNASTAPSQAKSMHLVPSSKSVLRKAAPTRPSSGGRSSSRVSRKYIRRMAVATTSLRTVANIGKDTNHEENTAPYDGHEDLLSALAKRHALGRSLYAPCALGDSMAFTRDSG